MSRNFLSEILAQKREAVGRMKAKPSSDRLRERGVDVAPRGALEKVLSTIFAEVLQLERVGVRDNFFDLGGHSLLATQIASRVREAFQVELPLRKIFESPTVEGLAQALFEDEGERIERTAELLLQLSSLSDEEAGKLIAEPASPEGKEPEQ